MTETKKQFLDMANQATDVESVILDNRPDWVTDFVQRTNMISKLITLHYQEIARNSGVYEGSNQDQINAYENDIERTVNSLMTGEDALIEDSLDGQIQAIWNPTNDYPGTRVAELYDINGNFINGG